MNMANIYIIDDYPARIAAYSDITLEDFLSRKYKSESGPGTANDRNVYEEFLNPESARMVFAVVDIEPSPDPFSADHRSIYRPLAWDIGKCDCGDTYLKIHWKEMVPR